MAIIVPDGTMMAKWAGQNGLTKLSYAEVLRNEKTIKFIKNEIITKAKEGNFNSLEIPKEVYLSGIAFTVENELLTPTFEIKRNEAK